jgi:thiamine-phosphate diphosphorylase
MDEAFVTRALAAVEAGGKDIALHVRGRSATAARRYEVAIALRATCERLGARLLVNDRVDVALAAGADGVQLRARSFAVADARALLGARRLIGYSAHAPDEAGAAVSAGADFVILGSIWETRSHPGSAPAGLAALRTAADHAGAPVIAIGGVTPARVRDAAVAGAWGVAVLSGVWSAEEVGMAVATYLDAIRTAYTGDRGKEQA